MGLLVVMVFTLLFLASRLLVRDRIARIVLYLYSGWWFLCLLVSTFDLFGIYPVSSFTYFLLLLNVGTFVAGFIAMGWGESRNPPSRSYGKLFESLEHNLIHNPKLTRLLILFSFYLFYYFRKFQAVTSVLPGSAVRALRFSVGPIFGSAAEILFYNYFADTLAIFLIVVIACCLILAEVRTWLFFWALVDLVLFVGIGAGRTLIVEAGIFVVLIALLRNSLQPRACRPPEVSAGGLRFQMPPRKNLLLYVALPVAVLIGFSIYVTAFRTFDLQLDWELAKVAGTLFLDQAQYYSTGPFRALDYAVHHPHLYGFHYGALTFGAVDELVVWPLTFMGFKATLLNETIGGILDHDIFIGTNFFNALYTCVFRFYFDFGIPGVAVFSFLFGAALRGTLRLFNSFPCFSTFSLVLYLFGASFLSSQNWHLGGLSSVIFLSACYGFYRMERARLTRAPLPGPGKA